MPTRKKILKDEAQTFCIKPLMKFLSTVPFFSQTGKNKKVPCNFVQGHFSLTTH
jgi:hypothetical protein